MLLEFISKTCTKGKSHSFNLPKFGSNITIKNFAASSIIKKVDYMLKEEEIHLVHRLRT